MNLIPPPQSAPNRPQTSIDERRQLVIPGDKEATIAYCAAQFVSLAAAAIAARGKFTVALSGGSTPKALFELLTSPKYRCQIDWQKCWLFWSDERAVTPTDPESNYHMAMEAGIKDVGIPSEQIYRMHAEENIEENAIKYESAIRTNVPSGSFDLLMLGMGDDGHTASLFPHTAGLSDIGHLVIANFIPQKKVWRMTLTFDCINSARQISVYVLGSNKASMLTEVLKGSYQPDELPIQRVGTPQRPATWICDVAATQELAC